MLNLTKSKNIIISFMIALILVPCAFIFTACGMNITKVASYQELVNALNGNMENIQLTSDIDVEEGLQVTRKVTLDLNGKKLYNSKDLWDNSQGVKIWSIISVKEGGDLTIKGEGTISAKENDCYALDVMGGKLTIENGEFIGNISAVYSYKGDVIINGGTYSILQKSTEFGDKLLINLYDQSRKDGIATLKVYGGTFKSFNPAEPMEEGYELLAEGYESKLVEGSETDYVVTKKA